VEKGEKKSWEEKINKKRYIKRSLFILP